MSSAQLYILAVIVMLALIAGLKAVFIRKKSTARISRLAGLAFVLIIAGVAFSDHRLLGHSLIGGGVALALVDMVRQWRQK